MDALLEEICSGLPRDHAQLIRSVIKENVEVRSECERVSKLHSKAAEEFEQERYSVKKRIDMLVSMEAHYTEEIGSLQSQLDKLSIRPDQQKLHEAELGKLKLQVSELTTQLEESQARGDALQEQLGRAEQENATLRQEQEAAAGNKSLLVSEDYLQLQTQNTQLLDSLEETEQRLQDVEAEVKCFHTERDRLQAELSAREEVVTDLRGEVSSYRCQLETMREEKLDLQGQLNLMKVETADHSKKGNSLFGELDDRRLKAEQTLVDYKSQYELAHKQLAKEKQLHHLLKVQMTTLLQANSDSVTSDKVERLQATIYQLRNDKEALVSKLKKIEAKQKDEMAQLLAVQSESEDTTKPDFTQFLKAIVQSKENEILQVKEEIHRMNMKMLSMDDKVIEGNRKIVSLERELDRSKHRARQLTLKLDELKMKYEPEKENVAAKTGKTEKIPLATDEDAQNDKTKFILKESFLPNQTQESSSESEKTQESSPSDTKCAELSTTASDAFVSSLQTERFGSSKQVKIKDSVEAISEDGGKESVRVNEEKKKTDENIRGPKKARGGIVHHNVKKVSKENVENNQCHQQ